MGCLAVSARSVANSVAWYESSQLCSINACSFVTAYGDLLPSSGVVAYLLRKLQSTDVIKRSATLREDFGFRMLLAFTTRDAGNVV